MLRRGYALSALAAVSGAGALDVAEFLARRPGLFTEAPGRAFGSVLGLLLWLALGSAAALTARDGQNRNRMIVPLAILLAFGNVGLTIVHLRANVGGWRTWLGGGLGVAALGLGLLSAARFEP